MQRYSGATAAGGMTPVARNTTAANALRLAAIAAVVGPRLRRQVAELEPVIRSIMAAGKTTPTQTAAALNELRVPASRGGIWRGIQVSRVLARMKVPT